MWLFALKLGSREYRARRRAPTGAQGRRPRMEPVAERLEGKP